MRSASEAMASREAKFGAGKVSLLMQNGAVVAEGENHRSGTVSVSAGSARRCKTLPASRRFHGRAMLIRNSLVHLALHVGKSEGEPPHDSAMLPSACSSSVLPPVHYSRRIRGFGG